MSVKEVLLLGNPKLREKSSNIKNFNFRYWPFKKSKEDHYEKWMGKEV